ncbi:MAG: EAL domain-containing protein [Burkholderiales bacterium]|nr:EAL domain-containing protein [Burkholderiales bacterium]MDE2395554.1 EAL domain-containing protein [Burkholderiales bacterium]MDE2455350.1 EAL domain-containing protein [Burkholderiales bacterium]
MKAREVEEPAGPEGTTLWHVRLLDDITRILLAVGSVGSAIGVGFALYAGRLHIAAFDVGVVAWLAALVHFRERLSFNQRSWGILLLTLAVGAFFLVQTPPLGLIYLSLLPLMAALFLGMRAAAACLGGATLLIVAVGWSLDLDWGPLGLPANKLDQHLLMAVNFALMNALIMTSITVLMRNLNEAVRRAVQAQIGLEKIALSDSLTGLPNRRLLMDRLEASMGLARRTGQHGAVLFIDLDHFKKINDSQGHAGGDLFLQLVAQRLKTQLARQTDTLARLGGDEFVALLADLAPTAEEAARAARQVAERLRAAMAQPFVLRGEAQSFSASIGVALFPSQAVDANQLLDEADTAMYHAKDSGRNAVGFYEASMQVELQKRLETENDLAQALPRGELWLAAQPQYSSCGEVCGVELLLRWRHPTRGEVPPSRFIPIAEQTGLIGAIGDWVLQQACEQVALLRRMGHRFALSVNISPSQFRGAGFVERVAHLLEQHGVCGSDLMFEVTEGLMVDDQRGTIDRMRELVALGVRFSIDDFGTGYSSLNYLKRLPLHELKIDRSFVQDLPQDPNDTAIVRMIVSMAREFKLDVVAEGVETAQQAAFLTSLGCNSLQGYYLARPQPLRQWVDSLAPVAAASA